MLSKLFKNFQKKEKLPLDYFYTTDLHSHLIPNIDDGVKTLEESVEIIKNLKNLGYKKLITTPHIMSHRFPNNKETILSGFEKVKNELIKQNIDIELHVAAEYYYDEHFIELIRKKDLLTFVNSKKILSPFMFFLKDDLKTSQDVVEKVLTHFINVEFKINE